MSLYNYSLFCALIPLNPPITFTILIGRNLIILPIGSDSSSSFDDDDDEDDESFAFSAASLFAASTVLET